MNGSVMTRTVKRIAFASAAVLAAALAPAQAAEREKVRMVINLIAGVKMPFPENLRDNVSRTERVTRQQRRNNRVPPSR
jgi:vacuolar-type H+-ATPase subunit D/Vma8